MTVKSVFVRSISFTLLAALAVKASGDSACPTTTAGTTQSGSTLQGFATTGGTGVVYDPTQSGLTLSKAGGLFGAKFFAASGNPHVACPGDFDGDGWTDFIGVNVDGTELAWYRNMTKVNQDADILAGTLNWNNSAYSTTPRFDKISYIEKTGTSKPPWATGDGAFAIGCGDFNKDNKQDFFVILEVGNDSGRPYRADMFIGKGDGTFQDRYQLTSGGSADSYRDTFRDQWWDSMPFVVDYNGDGYLDFLWPAEESSSTDVGYVQVYYNVAGAGYTANANKPTFTAGPKVLSSLAIGNAGASAVSYMDFTGDGIKDLAITGVKSKPVRTYPGLSGGTFSSTYLSSTDTGWTGTGAQILVGADFNLDGKNDLVLGTDNATGGSPGQVVYWANSGATTYVGHAATQIVPETFSDFDAGFGFDYDNDPDKTQDFMFADGNGAGYSVFANRVQNTYVACGDVISGTLDLGSLSSADMVITSARLKPTMVLPTGTSVTFYMSNEDPPNWQLATTCPDDSTSVCVTFPQATGRSIRWKATMCSNPARSSTPVITGVNVKYTYTQAAQHFRAGVVVDHEIAYLGSFQVPGDRGHLYASNAAMTTQYWDAATKLDAMADSARKLYTTKLDGKSRLDFTTAATTQTDLQQTLNVGSASAASAIVTWQRGARFGLTTMSRLGAIRSSTPAVLSPPIKPYYYSQLSMSDKAKVDAFITAQKDRPYLALFGSLDGAIHAINTNPSNTAAATNGTEAWAFIPYRVAFNMGTDKLLSLPLNYPDGSPTIADVKIGTSYRTVLIQGMGDGGKNYVALDITDSATAGPTPLWDYVPGDSNAGQASSKPVVVRVKVGGTERFVAIMATGIAYDNASAPWTKGRVVEAVDVGTGVRMWRFQAACPVTSDLSAFETDDDAESGNPTIDGYIDRVVFADMCGNVYKVDPAVDLPGSTATSGWTAGMGNVSTATTDPTGRAINALFSVKSTPGALGQERPIAGTLAARPDQSGRMILFFGTGGIESYDATKQNAFYAVYLDTGSIRDSVLGTCNATTNLCEKFYGGAVVSDTQVLVTRATDPPVATSGCNLGSASIVGFGLSTLSSQFTVATTSSIVSSLFGSAGALYATTLQGKAIRVGTPTSGTGSTSPTDHSKPVRRRAWRQVM
jgi:hypothetical protein